MHDDNLNKLHTLEGVTDKSETPMQPFWHTYGKFSYAHPYKSQVILNFKYGHYTLQSGNNQDHLLVCVFHSESKKSPGQYKCNNHCHNRTYVF